MTNVLLLTKDNVFRTEIESHLKQYAPDAYVEPVLLDTVLKGPAGQRFDILIIDINLQEKTYLINLGSIRSLWPEMKILVFIEEDEKILAYTYLKNGADGVCLKSMDYSEFQNTLLAIIKGEKYIFEQLTYYLLNRIKSNNLLEVLSPRESQVAYLLLKGLRVRQISHELKVTASTVSSMKYKIYQKMKVRNMDGLKNCAAVFC